MDIEYKSKTNLQAPAYAHGPVVAKAAVAGGLLGVAYSPATVVSHMTYSNPIVSYNW